MRRFSLGLILASALGCSHENLSPIGRDFYALQTVAGIPLPAPYAQNPYYNGLLVADSMSFRDDGTGLRHAVYQDENSTSQYASDEDFNWTRGGNSIAVTFVCPPMASCIAGPHLTGTIDETTITITDSKVTRGPLVYRRSGMERLESRHRH